MRPFLFLPLVLFSGYSTMAEAQQQRMNQSVVQYSNVMVQSRTVNTVNPVVDNIGENNAFQYNESIQVQEVLTEQTQNPSPVQQYQIQNDQSENQEIVSEQNWFQTERAQGENRVTTSDARTERSYSVPQLPRFSFGSSADSESVRPKTNPDFRKPSRYTQTSGKKKKRGSGRYRSHGFGNGMLPCFGF